MACVALRMAGSSTSSNGTGSSRPPGPCWAR
jgi:hypothetical protein